MAGLALAAVFVVLIGTRLTSDMAAVLIGVVVGIVASVPTSLLLVALLRRAR